MNTMTLHKWAIMVHDPSRTIGQVVETVYPANGEQAEIAQVLLLKDRTHWKFLLTELRLANEVEAQEFLRTE